MSNIFYVTHPGTHIPVKTLKALRDQEVTYLSARQPDRSLYAWSLLNLAPQNGMVASYKEIDETGEFPELNSQYVLLSTGVQRNKLGSFRIIAGDRDYLLLELE